MKDREHMNHLVLDVQSTSELQERLNNIDSLNEKDAKFAQGSGYGASTLIASVFNPENFIPVAAPFAKIRTVKALGQNLLFNAGIYGSIEATGLYADDTRTIEQATTHAMLATGLTATFGTMLSPSAKLVRQRRLAAQREAMKREAVEDSVVLGEKYFGEIEPNSGTIRATSDEFGSDTVGAARLNIEKDIIDQEIFDNAGLVTAGGLEKIGYNPTIRGLNGATLAGRTTIPELVDLGGLVLGKNQLDEATQVSAETEFRITYNNKMAETIRGGNDEYLKYRNRTSGGDVGNTMRIAGITARDWVERKTRGIPENTPLSYREFQDAVGKGMRVNTQHEIPEINAQIMRNRAILEEMGAEAQRTGLFTAPAKAAITRLQGQLAKLNDDLEEASGLEAAVLRGSTAIINSKIATIENKIDNIEKYGPNIGKSDAYFPRVWRNDKILADEDVANGGQRILFQKLVRHFSQGGEL
jgi:hypothetical protein